MAQLARFSPAAVVQRITRGGEAAGAPDHTIDEIIAEAASHRPNIDAALIRRAYDTAVTAHEGQLRSSGEEYITHPVAVTHYLATLQMDAETLAAALLHDVPEDTDYTIAEIEKRFGRDVARLVDGVTKLSKFGSARTMEEQQAENIRKMFMAMAEDVRVVIIKLADRLHNMQTLQHLPPEKQQRIARQTMEIYAPLAHRLGIWQIKWELEDLAFKYLEPEKYRQLVETLADRSTSARELRQQVHRHPAQGARKGRDQRRDQRAAQAPLLDRQEDGAQGRRVRPRSTTCYAIRVLVDDVKRLLRRARRRALAVAPGARAVRRLHRHAQGEHVPVAAHRGHRSGGQAARGADPYPADARDRGVRDRGALALQGRVARRPQVRREAGLGATAHGLAARGQRPAPSSSRASSSTSSRTRSSSSPPRATSRTCRGTRRHSTSPTASTPMSVIGPSAPR